MPERAFEGKKMNRRGFIGSLFALPLAIKPIFTSPTEEIVKYPWPHRKGIIPPPAHFENPASTDFQKGDLVYLHNGQLTPVMQNPSECIGVCYNVNENGDILVGNSLKWSGEKK